jgi:cell division protein FtsA
MKRRTVGAVDVGSTKICTIIADTDGTELRILGVGVSPSQGIQKGLVIDIDGARESIRQSIVEAEHTAGYKLKSAYVGITGRHILSVNNKGVVVITRPDQLIRPADMKRAVEVAKSVKIPNDHEILCVIPRKYVIDGQEGIGNPVGMHGFRLDVEVHVVSAASTSVQNLVKSLHRLGVSIDDLVFEPMAAAEAVLTEDEKQGGVVLADIGGGTTDVAIFSNGSIYHSAILPVGGSQITNDISVGLDISFELAEELKKKYGDITPREENQEEEIDLGGGQAISYPELLNIIRMRVEEIIRLILLELQDQGADLVPSGLVITGGTANIPGIVEIAKKITRLPVRIGIPTNLSGVAEALYDPSFATSVGLLLWGIRNGGLKISEFKDGSHGFFSRIPQLFGIGR